MNLDKFDDGGVMALICHHDIPLFLTNIDTPGEQQKYSVSLLEHLLTFIPKHATVNVLYDIGCVLDCSLDLYPILPEEVVDQLQFATSAMHAYAHQWTCQLEYNPRLKKGLGLSDGEGVERTWSKLQWLIALTRMCAHKKCIWILDKHVRFLGSELWDDLGDNLRRKLKTSIPKHEVKASAVLEECSMTVNELWAQWEEQKEAQMSVTAYAPVKIKCELDFIINLQMEVENVDKLIQMTHQILKTRDGTKASRKLMTKLEKKHKELHQLVDDLYASLDIQESFPELSKLNLNYI